MIELLTKAWNYKQKLDEHALDRDCPSEHVLLSISPHLAKKHLSWRCLYSVEKAVKLTVDWYKANLKGNNIMEDQINDYENTILKANSPRN